MVKYLTRKNPPPLWGLGLKLLICIGLSFQISLVYAEDAFNLPLFKEFQGKVYVSTSSPTIMLGERITLTIKGENLDDVLTQIDWQPIKKHFHINDIDIGFNRIKVRLYPFESGSFHIPSQSLTHIVLPDFTFHISPNPNISIQWKQPSTQLYLQQNTPWKATVWVKNSANKVTLEMPKISPPPNATLTLSSLPVPSTHHLSKASSDKTTGKTEVLVANYQFSYHKNQLDRAIHSALLPSPAVVIKNPSNQKWFFFDRPVTVSVHPLPHFLPTTTPVGKLTLSPAPLAWIQKKEQLNYWTWQFIGQNMSQQDLKQAISSLIENRANTPQIEWLTESYQINTYWTEQGIQTKLTLQLPYRITQTGWINFPPFNTPFFNPITGKLESLKLPTQKRIALPNWIFIIGQLIALLFTLWLLYWIHQSLKYLWLRQQLIQSIKRTHHAQALWSVMQQWAHKQQAHPVNTLGEWTSWYHQTYKESEELRALMQSLNQQLYAEDSTSNTDQQWKTLKKNAQTWSQQTPWRPVRNNRKRERGGEI